MAGFTITKEVDGRKGRYVAQLDGQPDEAELTFTIRGDHLVSADHTGAPDVFRGTGAAAALAQTLIDDARANGFRIIPYCPYVRAQYLKHPDWADVMTVGPGVDPASFSRVD